jgi:PucR family transcriptional regulator, purine catabolism regulatory protein
MPLTVRDVLALDAVRAGRPVVVAAADRLDTPVRWVHAAEVSDVGRLLRGGELVLSTGIALPSSASGLADYVAGLAGAGVAGLAIELGQRYESALPGPLVSAAEARGVPLIVFERELAFVEITEAVHARIIDAQMSELLAAQRVHSVFTSLSADGAPAESIVRAAAELAGRPVILTDLSYRTMVVSGDFTVPSDFAASARAACEGRPRTFLAADWGWLVTTVGARGEDWGRLFLRRDPPLAPEDTVLPEDTVRPEDTVLIERAATTLALGRLLARQAESVERQAHRTLLSAIMSGAHPADAAARFRAMGVPATGRQLVAVVARIPDASSGPALSAQAVILAVADAVADACRDIRVPAVVGSLDDVRAGALLSLPPHADTDATLRQLSARLATLFTERQWAIPHHPVLGIGSPASGLEDARRAFDDAREVADVAIRHPGPDGLPFYRLPDLRLRGLLHVLRDDPRLSAFASRELGSLLSYDASHGTSLLSDLQAYLEAGGNKAVAASRAHLARPTFYQRLRLIEHILGVSLAPAESRASLHVALLALKPDD